MSSDSTSSILDAYQSLVKELISLRSDKAQLEHKLKLISNSESRLETAIEAIRPLIPEESVSPITTVIKWRTNVLEFLQSKPGMKFTSPQILEFIHPLGNKLSGDERRKAMGNLSVSLNNLCEKNQILKEDSKHDKGFLYFVNAVNETDNASIVTKIVPFGEL